MNSHTESFYDIISKNGLESLDYIVIGMYLIMLLGIGFLLGVKDRHKASTNDYFLAGNSLTWWAVGASLIAANISAEQFIGMSGTGFSAGIAIAAYELMAAVAIVLIGKFLIPLMMDKRVLTFPQFLQKRYSNANSLTFSIIYLILYVFINLTSVAWLSALALEKIFGVGDLTIQVGGIELSGRLILILLLFLIAGVYSIYGGMVSVAWTDVMQVIFIVGGGIVVAIFGLQAAAGADGTIHEALKRILTFFVDREHYNDIHMHLIIQESHSHSGFDTVPGVAAIVGSVWATNLSYWAYNQFVTQKALAARSIDHAQKGFLFAAFLKILIPFLVLIPSICAYYMHYCQNEVFHAEHMINSPDSTYPWFVTYFIPTGIKGLAVVTLLAGATSSLASMLNSTSTIFTIDIYQKYINRFASDMHLVNVGRLTAIVALVLATLAVYPLLGGIDEGFSYIQEYSAIIYPGVIVILTMGFVWKRATSTASIWTAALTIPLGVAFKFLLPDVSFTFRAGYVYIILITVFVIISLCSKNTIPNTSDNSTRRKATQVAFISLTSVAVLSFLAATVVTVGSLFLPNTATPENNIIAYLKDIGFEAFFFFAFFVGSFALIAWSNSRSAVQDPNAEDFDLSLFRTSRVYTILGAVIMAIVISLYIVLW